MDSHVTEREFLVSTLSNFPAQARSLLALAVASLDDEQAEDAIEFASQAIVNYGTANEVYFLFCFPFVLVLSLLLRSTLCDTYRLPIRRRDS